MGNEAEMVRTCEEERRYMDSLLQRFERLAMDDFKRGRYWEM